MSNETLLSLAGAFAAALVVNAALLWLACRWLNVRHSATPERRGVTFRRASTLAACGLAATLLTGAACWTLIAAFWLALDAHVAVSLAASVVILRYGLPVGWGKALGVEATRTLVGVPVAFVAMLVAFDSTIATGVDMADAVRGEHREIVCLQCGYPFAIDAHVSDAEADSCTCPNCRLPIAFAPADVVAPPGFVSLPPARRPDRVLSLRSSFPAAKPERFDVVVVEKEDFAGNHLVVRVTAPPILRVIGLPGESIALHQGDVYLLDDRLAPEVPRRGAVADEDFFGGVLIIREVEDWLEANHRFWPRARLVRKPPAKVLAMMRLVYDSRYPAADLLAPEERRWAEDNGWRKDGIGFRHDGNAAQDGWLRYRHLLRPHGFAPSLITDDNSDAGESWVGDLILECDVEVGPSGEWALELSRGPDRFQARFDLTARTCTLLRLTRDKVETLATARVRVPATARVRFANVDERLMVWVNDRLVFGEGVPYAGPRGLLPVRENDLDRPASVAAKGAALRVRRLRLFRDTYLTDRSDLRFGRRVVFWGGRPRQRLDPFHPADPKTWGQMQRLPPEPTRLDAESYYLANDNHAAAEARPASTILGKGLLRFAPLSRVGRVE